MIVSLDIPDEYEYMDKELVTRLKTGVEFHLRNWDLVEKPIQWPR